MIIVDSSVWVDFFELRENEHTIWLEQQVSRETVALTEFILMEVLQGVRRHSSYLKIRAQLLLCPVYSTGGQTLAIASAENYRFLRSRGFTVRKSIDCLIATFCIREDHRLLHRDRDFDAFEQHLGLRVIHPVRQ